MTQNYGMSFAQRLIDEGRYDEAVALAAKEASRDPADPEPLVDRAFALIALERYAEAVVDLERALVLDEAAAVLEIDFVDDALFGALLGEARAAAGRDLSFALGRLGHYRSRFPAGRHAVDVETWSARLRGEGRDEIIVKEREA